MPPPDPQFARLVSLACHDLRTPLATVQGFAKTLLRIEATEEQRERYLGMIDAASTELGGLLDDLSAAARIEGGRYEPVRRQIDTLELARAAAERVEGAGAEGSGALVDVDVDAVVAALAALARAARRHGLLETVSLGVAGEIVTVSPVADDVAPILLGDDLKDLGAAVGIRVIDALGGSVRKVEDAVRVTLPGHSL